MLRLILVAAVVSLVTVWTTESPKEDSTTTTAPSSFVWFEEEAKIIVKEFDDEYTKHLNNYTLTQWNYYKNMTYENQAASEKAAKIGDNLYNISRRADEWFWKFLRNETVKRQLEKIDKKFVIGTPTWAMLARGYNNKSVERAISEMKFLYNIVKICDFTNKTKCDLAVKEVKEIMERSRDPEELKHIWMEWRKATGELMKSLYPKYVEYVNIEARLRNFPDQAAYWISDYEVHNFTEQIETVWQQLKPLYLQLHAYVRRELRKKYGEDVVSKDGPIPALVERHVGSIVVEHRRFYCTVYKRKDAKCYRSFTRTRGYNATGIFRLAEDFFKSINLSAMPDTFWERSILEKQKDVEMNCSPQAWDFYDGKDFRISQCTRVDMESLLTAHHEMAHIEYAMQYKDQPAIFKEGANPAFQEAVAKALTLSVSTPKHLKKIGLLRNKLINRKAFLNHLYLMGLDKIALMPFAYMMELWRWNVFQGNVTPDNYNCHWWSLAAEYQGIEPPVDRSEEDFDPGAIYNIINNVDYISRFVSEVLQFQIHSLLCKSSFYPLHKCHHYGNKNAGNLLKSMMELGSSKPWPDAMEKMKGQRQIDAAGLLKYFRPLLKWLTKENKKNKEYVGWKPNNKRCVKTRKESIIKTRSDEF